MAMDWDDEDEKTTVYEKGGQEDAAKALLRSAPAPAAGAPATATVRTERVGAAGAVAAASGGTAPAMVRTDPPAPRPVPQYAAPVAQPGPRGSNQKLILGAAVAAVGVVGLVGFLLHNPFAKAGLLVTVAGPNNRAVDSVEVSIENESGTNVKRCSSTPCRLSDAASGNYVVRVKADGFEIPAAEAVKLAPGSDEVLKVLLTASTKGTRLSVAVAKGTGLSLSVNGKDEGPLPARLEELEPGEYTIRISDEKGRYEKWEKVITLERNKAVSLEPTLKVAKGLARVKAGSNSDGAKVLLVSGNERRPLPRLPMAIEITPDKQYRLVATRLGFQDYERDISFDDGVAEKDFEVSLAEKKIGGPLPVAPPPQLPIAGGPLPPTPGPLPTTPVKPGPVATDAPAGADVAGAPGTISINSIPVSAVLVDGRPVGQTPTTWKGAAGNHTVVFVHAEFGRKMQAVSVKPGGNTVVAVRFP